MNRVLIHDLATGKSSGPSHRPRREPARLSGPLSRAHTLLEELADATLDGARKDYLADLAVIRSSSLTILA
jgi:hypothetical protein